MSFTGWDKTKHAEASSKGGKAAHAQGKAHCFTHEQAVAAAKKAVALRRAKAAMTTDAEDERIVDSLVAKRTETLTTRPLRGRKDT